MSRAVYIGGFGNGWGSVERVGYVLKEYYTSVEPFTFSLAMNHPDIIRDAVKGADVLTHSAGMVTLKDTRPASISSIGAPLPTSPFGLVFRTVLKTARMHIPGIGIRSTEDVSAVFAYDASAGAELARNLKDNLRHLGTIGCFNAVDAGIAAKSAGIDVSLGYNSGDEYFRLSVDEEQRAKAGGVDVVRMPGIHDELVIRPELALAMFLGMPSPAQQPAFA